MLYMGIDYHKRYSQVSVIDQKGETVWEGQTGNTPEAFSAIKNQLPTGETCQAVFEAGRTWGVMFDLLEETGLDPIVAHPLKLRPIAETFIKTDERDARDLAIILKAGMIPAIHIPSKEIRNQKNILRQRVWLVRLRTMTKNRIHQLLDRNHVQAPRCSDIFGTGGTAWLKSLELPQPDDKLLESHLEILEFLGKQLKETERWIKEELQDNKNRPILESLPGFGVIFAAMAALEIDSVGRFSTKLKLCSYAGLIPSTYASGGKVFHGRAISSCNHYLRYVFVEAAWTAVRYSPYFKNFYGRLRKRIGPNKAIVAVARKLCEISWECLNQNRPYEERPYKFYPRTALALC